MSDKITIRINNTNYTSHCVVVHDERWYWAKEAAIALGYKNK